MSKISLKPNASGTGVFSLEAPNSNVDRTLNLPDEAGTLATVENLPAGYTDSDALDLFNATGSAPVYACRAWVNFNGEGTVSIRESGNVSSITDNGTGEYSVNFTTTMTDVNYCSVASGARGLGSHHNRSAESFPESANSAYVETMSNSAGVAVDLEFISVSIFR